MHIEFKDIDSLQTLLLLLYLLRKLRFLRVFHRVFVLSTGLPAELSCTGMLSMPLIKCICMKCSLVGNMAGNVHFDKENRNSGSYSPILSEARIQKPKSLL